MRNSTLHAHLHRIGRDHAEPLRVLVVHDGPLARKRVERLLTRIRGRLGTDLRLVCAYQRLDELHHRDVRTKAPRIELVFLAAGCCATLPQETLAGVASLLPGKLVLPRHQFFLPGRDDLAIPAPIEGLLIQHVVLGQVVAKGQTLATIENPLNEEHAMIRARTSGIVHDLNIRATVKEPDFGRICIVYPACCAKRRRRLP